MKKLIFFTLLLLFTIITKAQYTETIQKFEKELLGYFQKQKITKKEIPNKRSKDKIYSLVTDESHLGFAVLASAKGRIDLFDFMVIYNSKREIEFIKVLVYRSSHGQEITNKNWLKQFYLKKGQINYGKDIQAISGATLSAKSLTDKITELNTIITEANLDYHED